MKMQYLTGVYADLVELKKAYYKLCKKLHPDHGGDEEQMKVLNAEYDYLFNRFNKSTNEDNKAEFTESSAEFIHIVEELLKMDDLTVELCGSWLWISGNTKPHKEELKALGCRWASKKFMWYWKPSNQPMSRSHGVDMLYIRTKYGSQELSKAGTIRKA